MDDLENLKYADLRKLAKKLGIKANQKADKIIVAIRELSGDASLPNVSDINTESEKECTTATATDSEPEEKVTKRRRKGAKGRKTKKNASTEQFTSEDECHERAAPKAKKATSKPNTPVVSKSNTPAQSKAGTPAAASKPTPKPLSAIKKPLQKSRPSLLTPKHHAYIKRTSVMHTPHILSSPGIPTPRTSTPRVLPSDAKRKSTPKRDGDTPKTRHRSEVTPGSSKKTPRGTPQQAGSAAKRRSKSLDVPKPGRKSKNDGLMSEDEERPRRKSRNSLMSEDDEVSIKPRRNTFTKDEEADTTTTTDADTATTTDVSDIRDSMRADMTQEEMRASLMDALDKKVERRSRAEGSSMKTSIPRYNGLTAKSNTSGESKSKTPNKDWSRIHKRQWDKMESLDDYLAKKRKRNESMTQSVKKMRLVTEQLKADIQSRKKPATPASVAAKKTKAAGPKTTKSQTKLFPTPAASGFKPTVMSTSGLNLNFKKMYGKDTKTPVISAARPRKSTRNSSSTTDGDKPKPLFTIGTSGKTPTARKPANSAKENLDRKSVSRKSMTTPFKNTNPANTSQVSSTKKFDIKESLSKVPTWQPHKGKLKPFNFGPLYKHETEVKEVKVKSREDRRNEHKQRITDKRKGRHMASRGIDA